MEGATRYRVGLTPPLDDLGAGRHFGGRLVTALPDSHACVFGWAEATTAVVLFGDSHAESWVPAFEGIADAAGFRLVALTTSECPPATATVWSVTFRRASALKQIGESTAMSGRS